MVLARLIQSSDLAPALPMGLVQGELNKGTLASASTSVPGVRCPDFCPFSPYIEASQCSSSPYILGVFKVLPLHWSPLGVSL